MATTRETIVEGMSPSGGRSMEERTKFAVMRVPTPTSLSMSKDPPVSSALALNMGIPRPTLRVVRVVALSGGYSRQEANERLSRSPGLIASFSRALSEGLNANQTQGEFDRMLAQSIKEIYDASIT